MATIDCQVIADTQCAELAVLQEWSSQVEPWLFVHALCSLFASSRWD